MAQSALALPIPTTSRIAVSASGIGTWFSCQRKWGWTYLAGLRSPPTGGQALGTRVHAILERYLRDREPIDVTTEEGRIAANGAPHLDEIRDLPGLQVERAFTIEGPKSLWRGFKDVEIPPSDAHPGGVWDHKTTSSLGWAKSADDLLHDPQAVLYAHDFAVRYAVTAVRLVWLYYETKGSRRSRPVRLTMSADHAAEGFAHLEDAAAETHAVRAAAPSLDPSTEGLRKHILSLPASSSHCEAFGGCPFRSLCNLSPNEKLRSLMSQAGDSLFARMRAANARDDGGATPAPAPPPVPAPPPPPPAPPVTIRINPPEGDTSPIPPSPTAEEKPVKRTRATKAEMEARRAAASTAPAVETDTARESFANRYSHVAPLVVIDAEKYIDRSPRNPPPAPAPPVSDTLATHTRTIGSLFVGCLPMVADSPSPTVRLFDDLVSGAKALIEKEFSLSDYRFAEYGKGPGYLTQAIAKALDESGPIDGLFVDPSTPEAAACLSLLRSRARTVVTRVG